MSRRIIQVAGVLGFLIFSGLILARFRRDDVVESDSSDRPYPSWEGKESLSMWGRTEQMGCKQDEAEGLLELGEVAERRYRLNVTSREEGMLKSVLDPLSSGSY